MSASAFRAQYSDWRLIKTRGVVQCVFEVDLADADKAYEVLGGMPNPSSERWFGIAALKKEALGSGVQDSEPKTASSGLPRHAKRSFNELPAPQQAGIRCEEVMFQTFLKETYPDDWHESGWDAAECVRLICGVTSRSELSNQPGRWNHLNEKYEGWKALERA